jgi:signal transduction histidine kinase
MVIPQNLEMARLTPEDLWKALGVLAFGLILTAISVIYTKNLIEKAAVQDFEFDSAVLQNKMEARLRANAQLLRSGVALFATADTVTREMWGAFYEHSRIKQHMPGIEGFGYTMIIPPEHLTRHVRETRESGFPEYTVWPEEEREIYTSIIYLEPFTGRNLRALGYDMFSEEVRQAAMKTARDSAYAVLSGKVRLVQETSEDIQAGTLMYSPVYRRGMPAGTVEERRAAIQGWVYSPYRINDLTEGILGDWDHPGPDRIHLRIYDNIRQSGDDLLYDSQQDEITVSRNEANLSITLPVRLNSEEWIMVLSRRSQDLSLFNVSLIAVFTGGFIISFLLFFLTLSLLKTSRDVKQIQQLNVQLEKINRDKDRFISILGHDLRNPFNSLLGFLDLLIKDFYLLEEDKIKYYLGNVNTVAKNTYGLLENLMEWSNTQSGNVPFKPEIVSFKDICDEVCLQVRPTAETKNIKVNNCTDEDIKVFAESEMLKTILRNLCTNAIKFTNRGGKVVICAVQDNGYVKVTVSDTGVGIQPELIPKLFDISRSVTTRGTENEGGTGLGLIICRELVSVHGGNIWVESTAGKGTTFVFTLPVPGQ